MLVLLFAFIWRGFNVLSPFTRQGKNEQMTEHIKQLRACIRHFLQVETTYLQQIQELRDQINEEKTNHETYSKLFGYYGVVLYFFAVVWKFNFLLFFFQ